MASHGCGYSADLRRLLFLESVVCRLRLAVIEGFTALPHRGLEIGGLLIGSEDSGDLRIDSIQEIPCEHRYGPSYALSESDREKLTDLLAKPRPPEAGQVIGFFQSFTGREPGIEEAHESFVAAHFPRGDFFFLLLQPLSTEHCLATLRLFRDGVVQPEFGDATFAFEPKSLPVIHFDIRHDLPTAPQPAISEPQDQHWEPAADEVPISEPVPLPTWIAAEPSRRSLGVPALVAIAALMGGAAGYALKSSQAMPPAQALWAELRLDARFSGEKLLVTWDSAGMRSFQAVRGTLRITEEGTQREIPLDGTQIAAGRYQCTPSHSDVAVRLAVTERGQPVAMESVRLAPAPTTIAVPIPNAQPSVTPAANPAPATNTAREHVPPVIAHEVQPAIPASIRSRIKDEVVIPIEVQVSVRGRVVKVHADRRSGDSVHRYLVEQAIKAARSWRFKPARTSAGTAVSSVTTIQFVFRP